MSTPNDGGPAFPTGARCATHYLPNGDKVVVEFAGIEQAMSLRDWFAGQALAGICSSTNEQGDAQWEFDAAAQTAYVMADAMLAAREKGKE